MKAGRGEFRSAAELCLAVRTKLQRAGRDEFPDVVVPAALLAHSRGDDAEARRWLATVRASRRAIQTYHMIIVYRQLYDVLDFGDDGGVDAVRSEVVAYLEAATAG